MISYEEAAKKFSLDVQKVRKFYQLVFHPIHCEYCNYQAPWPNYLKRHILRYSLVHSHWSRAS